MISIVPCRTEWPQEFAALGAELRRRLGSRALRIDHIGSTSVPGLAAKDIIDIQITVQRLEGPVQSALEQAGFRRVEHIGTDHVPTGAAGAEGDWAKWIFKAVEGRRPVNVHVRLAGRPNQRYPLLFRDYLRAHPAVAEAYAQVKTALARYHPDDLDAYYDVKDPVCDIIMGGAEAWAASTHWEQGSTDC